MEEKNIKIVLPLPTKFVVEVPSSLECSICREVMKDSVVFKSCGHSFCLECIKASCKIKKQCPIDRQEFVGHFKDSIVPNFSIRQQIESLLIFCPFGLVKDRTLGDWNPVENGCKIQISLSEKDIHVASCIFALVKCTFSDDTGNYCGFVCERKDMKSHQSDCDYLPVQCKNKGCNKMICKKFMEKHTNLCRFEMVECDRGCGASISRSNIKEHECDFEKCLFYDYGCKFRSHRSEMEKHIQTMVATHLGYAMKVLQLKQMTTKELIVDSHTGNGYPTIQLAIDAASFGDSILVFPGNYDEKINLYKSVNIRGVGDCEKIKLCPSKGSCISISCDSGSIANMSIIKSDKDKHFAINVFGGSAEVKHCDISSKSLGCLKVKGGNPKILHNNIHHSAMGGGVYVLGDAYPTIEGNRIHDNALTGIEVKEGGAPIITRNFIYNHKESGIFIHSIAFGTVEENVIFSNTNGVKLKECNPTVTRNTIRECSENGIYICGACNAKVWDNSISECKNSIFVDKSAF